MGLFNSSRVGGFSAVIMLKDKFDARPYLIKVGVVVALSFAGLFIIRLKSRSRSSQPPRSQGLPCLLISSIDY